MGETLDVVHDEDTSITLAEVFDSADQGFFAFHDLEHFFGGAVTQRHLFNLAEAAVFSLIEAIIGLMDGNTEDPCAEATPFGVKALDIVEGAEHGFLGNFFSIGGIGEVAADEVIHVTV